MTPHDDATLQPIIQALDGEIDPASRADEDIVELKYKPSWKNNLLEVEVNMKVRPPGVEITGFGLTVATKLGDGRQIEARSMGWNEGPDFRSFAGLVIPGLSKGRHAGLLVAGAGVKITDSHFKLWVTQEKFEFDVG